MSDPAYLVRSVHRLLEIHDDGDELGRINEDLGKAMDEMSTRHQDGEKAKAAQDVALDTSLVLINGDPFAKPA